MRGRWTLLAGLVAACLLASSGLAAADVCAATQAWARQRAEVRKSRQGLAEGAETDRQTRAEKAAKIVAELIGKGQELGAVRSDPDLASLVSGVALLNASSAATLRTALDALPSSTIRDDKTARLWTRAVDSRRQELLRPTERLFRQALEAGATGIARDCIDQALVFWPDHPDLRRNLGETRFFGRWYGPRGTELVKDGLMWDDRLGWIVAKERARYAKGDYFDRQSKQWMTLEEADRLHADPENGWVVETEHLELRGTSRLTDLVETANRLEEFYDRVFAAYAGFFLRPAANGRVAERDVRLIFGILDHPRLLVNVARDKEGYQKSLPPLVRAGWSAGMFVPATGQSYFYSGYVEATYHEFTHQILHVFSAADRAPVWLVEGAAVYTQAPVFHDGRMELGEVAGNNHLQLFIEEQRAGKALPLSRILALEDGVAWSRSSTPELNYPAAGAVVQFCMEANDRRHRADFIDFLRDSYHGDTHGYRLWEYLGMDYATFERSYNEWVVEFAREHRDGR